MSQNNHKNPNRNCIPWPWFSQCSSATWVQVLLREITSSLFLELCFTGKTIHTSWPTFLLVSKMSEARKARLQQGKLRLKRIITEKHREINELLEEVETRNINKARKEKINIIFADLHEQLRETEEALVLIST